MLILSNPRTVDAYNINSTNNLKSIISHAINPSLSWKHCVKWQTGQGHYAHCHGYLLVRRKPCEATCSWASCIIFIMSSAASLSYTSMVSGIRICLAKWQRDLKLFFHTQQSWGQRQYLFLSVQIRSQSTTDLKLQNSIYSFLFRSHSTKELKLQKQDHLL